MTRPESMVGDARLPRRFWMRIEIAEAGCWLWRGGVAGRGYGVMSLGGTKHYTHRLAYEVLVGPIADGLHIDHLCRQLRCANPAHLEPVTCRENLLRGIGPSALAAAATRCPEGHPYEGDNLYIDPRGNRQCKECRRIARRRHWNDGGGAATGRAWRRRNADKIAAYEAARPPRSR